MYNTLREISNHLSTRVVDKWLAEGRATLLVKDRKMGMDVDVEQQCTKSVPTSRGKQLAHR